MQHIAPLQLRAVQGLHDWRSTLNEKLLTFQESAQGMKRDSQYGIETLSALKVGDSSVSRRAVVRSAREHALLNA